MSWAKCFHTCLQQYKNNEHVAHQQLLAQAENFKKLDNFNSSNAGKLTHVTLLNVDKTNEKKIVAKYLFVTKIQFKCDPQLHL